MWRLRHEGLVVFLAVATAAWAAPVNRTLVYRPPGAKHVVLVGEVEAGHFRPADKATRPSHVTVHQVGGPAVLQAGPVEEDGIGTLIMKVPSSVKGEAFLVSGSPPAAVAMAPLPLHDAALQKALQAVVAEHVPGAPVPRLLQRVSIALAGDGTRQELVSAASVSKPASVDTPTATDYSVAALVDRGKVHVLQLDTSQSPLDDFRFLTAADLSGQGHVQVVLRSTYYEGQGIQIWDDVKHQPHRLLTQGWGL